MADTGGFSDFMAGGVGANPYTSNKSPFVDYSDTMKQQADRYNPYFDRGNQASRQAYNAYTRDLANPNAMQDQIASGFQMSPFQQHVQDMVTKRLNYNSANTGMLGAGAANRALMEELTKNTGQFQNEYVNRGLGVYGQSLSGLNGIGDMGLRAGAEQDSLMQEAAGGRLKGYMSENETNDRNRAANTERGSNMWGTGLGIVGGAVGAFYGGPAGAMAGYQLGKMGGDAISGGGTPAAGSGGASKSNYSGTGTTSGNWSY